MRLAHFDPFSGASGDMVLGALADVGADVAALEGKLRDALPFGVSLRAEKVARMGLAGTKIHVAVDEERPPRRNLGDIVGILSAGDIPGRVRDGAARTFRALAEAEARVHGTGIDEVHFHEVGAGDALVDILGAHWALDALGVERITCGPVPVGSGTVACAHGELPVPAPATAELLRGVPLRESAAAGELTTPTGAALAVTLAESFGPVPAMTLSAVGYGFGARDEGPCPNALRVFIGEATGAAAREDVVVLETTVDDMPGEWAGYLVDLLHRAGALEVTTAAVGAKKSRPAVRIAVVAAPADASRLAETILRETTTFGVRMRAEERLVLAREAREVETAYGAVRVQVGRLGDEVVQVSPEYEDCARAAGSAGVPLKSVYEAALAAARAALGGA